MYQLNITAYDRKKDRMVYTDKQLNSFKCLSDVLSALGADSDFEVVEAHIRQK